MTHKDVKNGSLRVGAGRRAKSSEEVLPRLPDSASKLSSRASVKPPMGRSLPHLFPGALRAGQIDLLPLRRCQRAPTTTALARREATLVLDDTEDRPRVTLECPADLTQGLPFLPP